MKNVVNRRTLLGNILKISSISLFPQSLYISNALAKQQLLTIRDTEIEDYLYEISKDIFLAAGLNIQHTKFILIVNDDIGAFATNGKNIFLYTGLFTKLPFYYQTLSVIAHELSHIIYGHPTIIKEAADKIKKQALLIAFLSIPLSAIPNAAGAGIAGVISSMDYFYRSITKFSRNLEEQADKKAAELLHQSNNDPRAMISTLQHMMNTNIQNFDTQSYYSTHPVTRQRINNLKANKTVLKGAILYNNILQYKYERIQGKLLGYFTDPNFSISTPNDVNSIKVQTRKCIAYMRLYQFNQARYHLKNISNIIINNNQLEDAYFLELCGDIEFRAKNFEESFNYYLKAVQLAPLAPLYTVGLLNAYNKLMHSNRDMLKEVEEIALRALNLEDRSVAILDQIIKFYDIEKKVPERELFLAEKDLAMGRKIYAKNRITPHLEYYKLNKKLFVKAQDILILSNN